MNNCRSEKIFCGFIKKYQLQCKIDTLAHKIYKYLQCKEIGTLAGM
jgi:hypothetical protein